MYIYIYMYENCANNACYLLWGNVSIVRWCIISKRHQLGDAQYLGNCFGAEPTSNEIYEGFSASLYRDEILNEHIKLNLPAIRTGPSWLITSLLPLNKCEWRLQAERVSAAIERSHFCAHQTRHSKTTYYNHVIEYAASSLSADDGIRTQTLFQWCAKFVCLDY